MEQVGLRTEEILASLYFEPTVNLRDVYDVHYKLNKRTCISRTTVIHIIKKNHVRTRTDSRKLRPVRCCCSGGCRNRTRFTGAYYFFFFFFNQTNDYSRNTHRYFGVNYYASVVRIYFVWSLITGGNRTDIYELRPKRRRIRTFSKKQQITAPHRSQFYIYL